MTDTPSPAKLPRFNHVAMSMPATALEEKGRSEILDFYGEVFGWQEMPTTTEDGKRLVLYAHRYDQFVFLTAEDEPMTCPRMDHFGQSVASYEELLETYQRAKAYREHDDRVDLVDLDVDEFPGLKLHSFYVGYLIPMMVETQFFEWETTRPTS